MAEQCVHVGTFDGIRFRNDETGFIIGFLEDKTPILGHADEGELVQGMTYQFYGRWDDHPEHGRQFKFSLFTVRIPHTRDGVTAYLAKYASGIGPKIAGMLWDHFGEHAVKVMRSQPLEAIAVPEIGRWLTSEKALLAAKELEAIAALEDTKIQLTSILHGRGFPGKAIDESIDLWRILAPARIRRDPFSLLVNDITGAGFARCDKLYLDLGLPPGRLKRQVMCCWHAVNSDTSGNTWFPEGLVVERLGSMVSGAEVQPAKAIRLGCRSGWLARYQDSEGRVWIADFEKAKDESFVAEKLKALRAWTPPRVEMPIARPGYDYPIGVEAQTAEDYWGGF